MNASSNKPSEENLEFPVADIKPVSGIGSGRFLQSKMWWITLLCLGAACYLAWHSHRPTGIPITIDFPEGHGLKAGDALRHRGIDVGLVTTVELSDDLDGVRATVELEKSAAAIANDQSRFWIVRPQLSLTNISGLETAVGSKYIAVDPGPVASPRSRKFTGLKDRPAVDVDNEGIEIALRGDESFGIFPGSPVSYRGVDVGQVMTVELGETSRSVVVRVRIKKQYAPLVCTASKFWKSSGVEVDFGLKGIHLNTESLATMARGGVSFSTPKSRNGDAPVQAKSGDEFTLHEKPEKSWLGETAEIAIK